MLWISYWEHLKCILLHSVLYLSLFCLTHTCSVCLMLANVQRYNFSRGGRGNGYMLCLFTKKFMCFFGWQRDKTGFCQPVYCKPGGPYNVNKCPVERERGSERACDWRWVWSNLIAEVCVQFRLSVDKCYNSSKHKPSSCVLLATCWLKWMGLAPKLATTTMAQVGWPLTWPGPGILTLVTSHSSEFCSVFFFTQILLYTVS